MHRVLALVTLALIAGCFNPGKPTCSYLCADSDPKCPDEYECRADGYCHLTGTTGDCPYSDAAMPEDMNASTLPDMTGQPDLAGTD